MELRTVVLPGWPYTETGQGKKTIVIRPKNVSVMHCLNRLYSTRICIHCHINLDIALQYENLYPLTH